MKLPRARTFVLSSVFLGAVISVTALSGTEPSLEAARADAKSWIGKSREALWRLNLEIWENPELGLEEVRSSGALSAFLEEHGFEVRRHVADMPTAFVASYGSGSPVIAVLAEFDALPGMSQAAVTRRQPREVGAPGHACGHSVYGVASVAGAVAARYGLERLGLPGTIRLYGTPAEETGIGKTYMVKAGLFSDCDVALHWHPGDRTRATFVTSKAVISVKYTFEGLPAHASLSPEHGRSALDAVELMNVGANYLREHLPEDARIHYVITDGGGQPNVVPPRAQVWYYLRANEHRTVETIFERMQKIAEGAALMSETNLSMRVESDAHELLPNRPISEVIQKNLERIGAPKFTEEEKEFARKTQLPLEAARGAPLEFPLDEEIQALPLQPGLIKASTDVGDVSWVVPTSGFSVACYTYGSPGHSWQIVACTGMSIGRKGMNVAAEVMAGSILDLLASPSAVALAKQDFETRRGARVFEKLIPAGQKPPVRIR